MSEVDTSAKAVKRWTVVRNNSGLGYSDGIAPDKYGGFVDYEAYRTLAAERDDLRAQLAEAQAQAQTARYDALRDAAAEASYQASEENDYRPPMVDVTSAILALIQPTEPRTDAAKEE